MGNAPRLGPGSDTRALWRRAGDGGCDFRVGIRGGRNGQAGVPTAKRDAERRGACSHVRRGADAFRSAEFASVRRAAPLICRGPARHRRPYVRGTLARLAGSRRQYQSAVAQYRCAGASRPVRRRARQGGGRAPRSKPSSRRAALRFRGSVSTNTVDGSMRSSRRATRPTFPRRFSTAAGRAATMAAGAVRGADLEVWM